ASVVQDSVVIQVLVGGGRVGDAGLDAAVREPAVVVDVAAPGGGDAALAEVEPVVLHGSVRAVLGRPADRGDRAGGRSAGSPFDSDRPDAWDDLVVGSTGVGVWIVVQMDALDRVVMVALIRVVGRRAAFRDRLGAGLAPLADQLAGRIIDVAVVNLA